MHFGWVSTHAADLGHTAVFPALVTGGTLHVIGPDRATDAARFGEYVAAHPLDVIKLTPSHLRALLSELGAKQPGPGLVVTEPELIDVAAAAKNLQLAE